MISVFTRQIEKLHREDGQALVFVAMVGMLIFMFFAMTANIAEITQTKIKQQNTADAVALSGAVWQARVLNTVSALNRNILDWWVYALAALALAMNPDFGPCRGLCCYGWCEWSPLCQACKVGVVAQTILLLGYIINSITISFNLQDNVLGAVTAMTLFWDLRTVMNLNYDFKTNTADIDPELFLALHHNQNDIFLINGPSGNPEYVLERGGWCETVTAIYYNYCRRGFIPGTSCSADHWAAPLRNIFTRSGGGGGPSHIEKYQTDGECEGSWFETSPAMNLPDGREVKTVHLYVLHTFDHDTYAPLNPEDLLPVTDGIYRYRRPPVVHLWGEGQRKDMQCVGQRDQEHWFPCTSEGQFNFAMAHAYSQSVSDFYRFLYDPDFNNGVEAVTPYPIPLAPAETDWEARLFPMEPGQDRGQVSSHAGVAAFDEIADNIGLRLGRAQRTLCA